MSLQLILEIRNVQIISLVLNKEMLCLAILKVKHYRTDLGTGCMRSRDYPVVKTSISFFLSLFFSLCVIKLFFFFRNAYSGAYFALFRPADRNKRQVYKPGRRKQEMPGRNSRVYIIFGRNNPRKHMLPTPCKEKGLFRS